MKRALIRTSVVAAALGASALTSPTSAAPAAPAAAAPAAPAAGSIADGVTHDENPRVPEGAAWTEAYFPAGRAAPVTLHADVLRPERPGRRTRRRR